MKCFVQEIVIKFLECRAGNLGPRCDDDLFPMFAILRLHERLLGWWGDQNMQRFFLISIFKPERYMYLGLDGNKHICFKYTASTYLDVQRAMQ